MHPEQNLKTTRRKPLRSLNTFCWPVLLGLVVILTSCRELQSVASAPPRRAGGSQRATAARKPVQPPKPGTPIDDFALTRYLEREAIALLRQGRVGTNLLEQTGRTGSTLKLGSPGASPRSPSELAEEAEKGVAVVGQLCRHQKRPHLHGTATGFFLTDSGALATCLHVLGDANILGLVVMTRDGRVAPVREVIAIDATNDLAILQVDGDGFTPLPISPAAAPRGSAVWVLSHPAYQHYTLTSGIVSRYLVWPFEGQPTYMQVTAGFGVGSSGAPVLDQHGAVVGMAKITKGIYADGERKGERNWQMVAGYCTPSTVLIDLARPTRPPN